MSNINQVLREKEGKLPPNLSDRLKRMLQKFSVLEDYFHGMVQNFYMNNHKHIHKDPDDEINHLNDVNILHLLNLTIWRTLEKFNVELLKRTKIYNRDELTTIYGDWETYAKTITNIRLLVPNIQESDTCIAQLAKIPIFPSRRSQPRCFVRQHCRVYLKNGNDYGYGLLHRLLFFIMAKYARNCAVFSEKEDKYIMDHLCSMSYNECQYIALSDFALPDLLAESHALCGMLGHAQFLTNDWVKTIMMHQVTEGCLRDEGIKSHETVVDATEPGILSITNPVMGGICNRHFTAVGLATFSNVVRYIIETYF
ncbi:hypothetical protein HW555_009162 [Spodoptera exigua]|uniref:Uncharacterized protein n=1 Tax=Spodoptera exigua TaxID=7107 RepID=A0A835GBN6_SPOEX|nr:hypothetical protein HW555_009162 [Spodoptera exigua]